MLGPQTLGHEIVELSSAHLVPQTAHGITEGAVRGSGVGLPFDPRQSVVGTPGEPRPSPRTQVGHGAECYVRLAFGPDEKRERTTGFEPATPTLARLCSTN